MTRGRWLGENGEREVMSLQSRRRLPVWVGVESMTGLKTRRFLPFHASLPPLMSPYFSGEWGAVAAALPAISQPARYS